MKSKMGFYSILALGVNTLLGSGIFLLPKDVYSFLGPYSFIGLVFSIILSIFLVLCFAEMAGKYPQTGSCYIYTREAFGPFVGFQIGFIRFASSVMIWATMAIALAKIAGSFWNFSSHPFIEALFPIVAILVFGFINLLGVKATSWLNNIFTIAKVLPLFLFIITGIFFIQFKHLSINAVNTQGVDFNISAGILTLFFAFGGFENIAITSTEMDNPTKNLPKAMIAVILIVSSFYFFIFLNTIGILGNGILHSKQPIADSMIVYLGPKGVLLASIATFIAILGSNMSISYSYTRELVPLALDGFIPKKIASLSKNGVPTYSVLITMTAAIALTFVKDFTLLVQMVMISLFFQYIPTIMTVYVSRKRGVKGTFMMPFASFILPTALILCIAILLMTDIKKLVYGGISWFVVGSLIYYLASLGKKKSV